MSLEAAKLKLKYLAKLSLADYSISNVISVSLVTRDT